jgi:hypothetical protein
VRTLDGTVRQGLPLAAFIECARAHIRSRSIDNDIFGDN